MVHSHRMSDLSTDLKTAPKMEKGLSPFQAGPGRGSITLFVRVSGLQRTPGGYDLFEL